MGALALFLVIAGGTAYAANTVGSSDIINDSIRSLDVRDDTLAGGGLAAVDLRPSSVAASEIASSAVRSAEVANENLTGADIANQSGVDTCVSTNRIGQLCMRAENSYRTWDSAQAHCGNLDLRLPTFGEAIELTRTHVLPNVTDEFFWTDEMVDDEGSLLAFVVFGNDGGGGLAGGTWGFDPVGTTNETVCVTTPTN
jgi:hypothetical protein